jgi:hypothetical protein
MSGFGRVPPNADDADVERQVADPYQPIASDSYPVLKMHENLRVALVFGRRRFFVNQLEVAAQFQGFQYQIKS